MKLFYYKINLFTVQLQFLGILQNMLIRLIKKRRENLCKNYVMVWVLMDIFKIFFDTGYFDYTAHNLLIVQVPAYVFFLCQRLYIKQKKLQSPGIHIYVPIYRGTKKNRHITYKRITKIMKAKENENKKDQKHEF